MKIEFVAFDSLGVKSMCTQVKIGNISILIDPGVAIETDSFPLPLIKRIFLKEKYKRRIRNFCKNSDIIIITHYHWDHHIPEGSIYKGKVLLIKDPKKNINKSQAGRANYFLKLIKNKAKKIEIADGKHFKFDNIKIKFSKALWHGARRTKLGKVLMVSIIEEKKILYTSDLDGPYLEEYADMIIKENPDILILDAFPSYLLGFIASYKNLKKAIKNTIKILENTNCELYIMDHHLLRDYRYREIYYEVYKKAEELGKNVKTASEEIGKEPMVIKAYKKYGPTRWKKWDKLTFKKIDEMIKHAKLYVPS